MIKIKSLLHKIVIMMCIFISTLSFSYPTTTLRSVQDNRKELVESYLSNMHKKIQINDLNSGIEKSLKKVIENHKDSSTIALLLYDNGEYKETSSVVADRYVKRGVFSNGDKEFLQDYGIVTTVNMTQYDIGYYWGGNHGVPQDTISQTRNGFDCSGFVHYGLRAGCGIELGTHTASSYNNEIKSISKNRKGVKAPNSSPFTVRTFQWSSTGKVAHIGFVSGKAQVHARGGENPTKWKTVDITKQSIAYNMDEIDVKELMTPRFLKQAPYSPNKIANMIAQMRKGSQDGNVDVGGTRYTDSTDLELTSADQFKLRINLDKVVFEPYVKALSLAIPKITNVVLSIFVILSVLDFLLFWLKNTLTKGRALSSDILFPLSKKFVVYGGYIALINVWNTLVIPVVISLFSDKWLKLVIGSDFKNQALGGNVTSEFLSKSGEVSNLTYIYHSLLLAPLNETIDTITQLSLPIEQILKGASKINIPFGLEFGGHSGVIEGILGIGARWVHIGLVAILYAYSGFCLLVALIVTVLIIGYCLYLVIQIMVATINALLGAGFSIFAIMLSGASFLQGYDITVLISNILRPLMNLTFSYIFIILLHNLLKHIKELFAQHDIVYFVFLPSNVVIYGLIYGLVFTLHKGLNNTVTKNF